MEPLCENLGVALHFGKRLLRKTYRRRNRRGVARVAAGRLDVLEDRADHRRLSVRHRVYVKLDRMLKKLVDENRTPLGRGDGLGDV